MSVWQEWKEHPERVWLREAIFKIHYWIGTGVGLYVVLMSLTGSLIVFRDQLEKASALVPLVEWIVDLHENLLLGKTGRSVNGIGAICVILLCLTGAAIWWPGIASWRRALTVNWRVLFARFTWDLHSALGFWSFLFVLMWGISGLYFAFPDTFSAFFGLIDPGDRFTDPVTLWLTNLHFGRFSWFTQAIWSFVGLVPTALALTGVFLCCRRVIFKAASVRPF